MSEILLPKNAFPAATDAAQAWFALLDAPELAQAVESETRKRAVEFLKGLDRYQKTPFAHDLLPPPTVFACGQAKLLEYGLPNEKAPVVFLIPSLINRYYILDLSKKLSFARYLRKQGLRVFVVDWGAPGAAERHYNCAMYVTEVLIPMLEWAHRQRNVSVIIGGYCMGGLLALCLAQLCPQWVAGLALFATPWNFFTPDFPGFPLNEQNLVTVKEYIKNTDEIPAETIHNVFHCANPFVSQDKMRKFATLDISSPAMQEFLALEHWVNDGVPMAAGVALNCFIDWAQYNMPAEKKWRVGGQIIDPETLDMPCFVAAPQHDKIVPSSSAIPLAKLLNNCRLVTPPGGHVGMMVGRNRKKSLWDPFCEWIFDLRARAY